MIDPMAFLSPIFLYFIPLCLFPILWHLNRQRKIRQRKIASLYFVDQIYGAISRKLLFSNWLELLLEMLFIILLCLSFANPYLPDKNRNANDVYFILDNSPSSLNTLKKWVVQENVLNEFWSILNDKNIYFCDFAMISRNISPRKILDKREFIENIILMEMADSELNMAKFDDYIINWIKETLGQSTLVIISDFKENHFNKPTIIDDLKVHYYNIHPDLDNVFFSVFPPNKKLEFTGGPSDLKLITTITKPPKNISLEIIEGEKPLFLEEINLLSTREQINVPILFDKNGYHHLRVKMTYQDQLTGKEIIREDFVTFYVSSPLTIYIQSSSEYFSLFQKMFSFDIEKKNIKLINQKPLQENERFDIAIVTAYDNPMDLAWLRETPMVLFIPKEVELKTLNNFLQNELLMDVNLIERFWNEEHENAKPSPELTGPFELLKDVTDINKIILDGEVSIQSYDLPIINRKTGGSFLSLGEKVVLYGFDAESPNSSFLPSTTGLGFIYQSTLYLLSDFDIKNQFGKEYLSNETLIPIFLTEKDSFNIDGGIYSNENTFVNVHPKANEWNAEPVDLKKIFQRAIALNNQPTQTIMSDYFIFRWLLLLTMLCLGLLVFLFYFRYQF